MNRVAEARKRSRAWEHAASAEEAAQECQVWGGKRAADAAWHAQCAWDCAVAGDEDGASFWAEGARHDLHMAEEQA